MCLHLVGSNSKVTCDCIFLLAPNVQTPVKSKQFGNIKNTCFTYPLFYMDFFFKLIYFSVINLRDKKKKKRRQFFLFLECFCSGNFHHQSSDNIHSEQHIMAKPWALWECRGDRSDGRWHCTTLWWHWPHIVCSGSGHHSDCWGGRAGSGLGQMQRHLLFILCLGQDLKTFFYPRRLKREG